MTPPVRVLHVDDEPGLGGLVAEFLERLDDGLSVVTETTAESGLQRLDEEGIDCVVSDYEMPGLDGIGFLEAVREQYPDLPFVLFTGKGSEAVASDAISSGATDYLQKRGGTEQYELLANRVRNAVEQHRSKHRAANFERLRNLAAETNRKLVRAGSRAEIEQEVCDTVSGAEPYQFAWIGEVDEATGRVQPRTSAGESDSYLDDVTIPAGDDPDAGPAGVAVREGRVAASQDVESDAAFEPWRESARERGFRSVAGVPLEHADRRYGVLVVYAVEVGAFDDDECALLEELAADVAHAIHAREVRSDLELRNRAIAEAPVGITITTVDGDDNPIVDANDAFVETTGYDREAVVGEDHRILQGSETEAEPVAELRAAIDDERATEVELRNYRADGTLFWNHVSIAPVQDDDGAVTNYIGFQEDVTERKRRERDLRHSEARFEAMFDDPNILVALLRADGTVRDVNETAMQYVGADLEDVRGVPFWETPWWSSAAVDDIEEWVARAADGEYVEYETEHEQSGDGSFVVEGAIRPVVGEDGSVESLVVSARDVTERVERTERLQRQNERFDELASVVSHDFQAPLSAARGWAELALETGDDEKLRRALTSLERADDLRADLVNLLRTREVVRTSESVDVGDAATDVWEAIAPPTASLDVTGSPRVDGDPSAVRRLLGNFLSNAVEHGDSDVTVRVGSLDGRDGFYVADDGPGIPPESRDEVFTPGFSTKDGGSGIGMASVREIVVAHDWRIAIADGSDGGARFEIATA